MVTRDVTGLSELHALLGEGASFDGTLTFEGRVRIDGRFRGRVLSSGVLILGQRSDVDAQLEVGTLIVLGGTLHGEVQAEKAVELHPDAKVYANVCAPQLMIDRGAVFEGQSRRPELDETPAEDAPATEDAPGESEARDDVDAASQSGDADGATGEEGTSRTDP